MSVNGLLKNNDQQLFAKRALDFALLHQCLYTEQNKSDRKTLQTIAADGNIGEARRAYPNHDTYDQCASEKNRCCSADHGAFICQLVEFHTAGLDGYLCGSLCRLQRPLDQWLTIEASPGRRRQQRMSRFFPEPGGPTTLYNTSCQTLNLPATACVSSLNVEPSKYWPDAGEAGAAMTRGLVSHDQRTLSNGRHHLRGATVARRQWRRCKPVQHKPTDKIHSTSQSGL